MSLFIRGGIKDCSFTSTAGIDRIWLFKKDAILIWHHTKYRDALEKIITDYTQDPDLDLTFVEFEVNPKNTTMNQQLSTDASGYGYITEFKTIIGVSDQNRQNKLTDIVSNSNSISMIYRTTSGTYHTFDLNNSLAVTQFQIANSVSTDVNIYNLTIAGVCIQNNYSNIISSLMWNIDSKFIIPDNYTACRFWSINKGDLVYDNGVDSIEYVYILEKCIVGGVTKPANITLGITDVNTPIILDATPDPINHATLELGFNSYAVTNNLNVRLQASELTNTYYLIYLEYQTVDIRIRRITQVVGGATILGENLYNLGNYPANYQIDRSGTGNAYFTFNNYITCGGFTINPTTVRVYES